jgi:hypothetical protein
MRRRCIVNEDKQGATTLIASLIGLITTLLAALNQYLRLRQGNVDEEEGEQLTEIVEEIDELEERLDEQEALLDDLRQK